MSRKGIPFLRWKRGRRVSLSRAEKEAERYRGGETEAAFVFRILDGGMEGNPCGLACLRAVQKAEKKGDASSLSLQELFFLTELSDSGSTASRDEKERD